MACMEHVCRNPECDFIALNNEARLEGPCPGCKKELGFNFYFDEAEEFNDPFVIEDF